MRRRIVIALLAATALSALLALSCGDAPLEPLDPGWVVVADFPDDAGPVVAICASYPSVFAVSQGGLEDRRSAIWRYQCGELKTEYKAPDETITLADVDVPVEDVHFFAPGYAVGFKEEGETTHPYVLRRAPEAEYWEKLPMTGFPAPALGAVYVTGEDTGWILSTSTWAYERGKREAAGFLSKFDGTTVRSYAELGPVTFAWVPGETSPEALYAVEYAGAHDNDYPAGTDPLVFISRDNGASWLEERMPRYAVAGHEIRAARAAATRNGELYIIARLDGERCYALIRRSGAPGAGRYEPAFISYAGPYLLELRAFAFKGDVSPYGITCDGVGVGDETTVVYDEGKYYVEKLPFPMNIYDVCPSDEAGFFAYAYDAALFYYRLLYHP